MAQGQTAYVVIRALSVMAAEPQSVPSLARAIGIGPRSARVVITALAGIGLVERVPEDPLRKRYRITIRGRELGGFLLLAEQEIEIRRPNRPQGNKTRDHTIRTIIRVLGAIAEQPASGRQLAERLDTGERSTRVLLAAFARLRLTERVPNDPVRRRQRITDHGRELGAALLLAKQEVEPYKFTRWGPRNRATAAAAADADASG
jgi:DNA-binding IclR family transcriptional regulator